MTRLSWTTLLLGSLVGCAEPPGWIDDRFFVRVDDDADLFVHAVGNGNANDFVLFLHGGPGGGASEYLLADSAPILHENAVMVYVDQRGQGASEGRTAPDDLTLAMIADDMNLMLDVVTQKYMTTRAGQPRLWLMGHSWGGLLGPAMLLDTDAADKVDGWIEVSGAHDLPRVHAASKAMVLEGAAEALAGRGLDDDDKEAWQEAKAAAAAAPDVARSWEDLRALNQAAHTASGLVVDDPEFSVGKLMPWVLARPEQTLAALTSQERVAEAILSDNLTTSYTDRYRELDLPTLLVWGRHDYVVPPALAQDVKLQLPHPDTELVVLEDSAHVPMFTEPEAYAAAVLDFIGGL